MLIELWHIFDPGVYILLQGGGERNQKVLGLGKQIKKEGREGKEISSFIYFKISSTIKGRQISRYDIC